MKRAKLIHLSTVLALSTWVVHLVFAGAAESKQIVEAMKKKGLAYEYIVFPDEGHGFAKPENRLKFYAAAEKFLAKHLGGRYEEAVNN